MRRQRSFPRVPGRPSSLPIRAAGLARPFTANPFLWLGTIAVAVNLAVITAEIGGDGWESNPPRTRQQRPANGFEDRGGHQPPYIPSKSEARPGSDQVRHEPL